MKKVIGVILGILGSIVVVSTAWKSFHSKAAYSISIIRGADGPTSVFIAGKVGHLRIIAAVAAGIILLVAAVLLLRKKK